jgi:hypothetical protein
MTTGYEDEEASAADAVPHDWARLLRKLRWAGLEEDAKRLESAVSTLPPDERGTVGFGPFSTD